MCWFKRYCLLEVVQTLGNRLPRQAKHQVNIKVIKLRTPCSKNRFLSLGRIMNSTEIFQVLIMKTLHADR